MKLFCSVYKSPRQDEMYLYLPRGRDFEQVPDALLEHFGKPIPVMDLVLSENRTLARADAVEVMAALEAAGYYLQMPPADKLNGNLAGGEKGEGQPVH